MKIAFGLRIVGALFAGALFSGTWLYFFFNLEFGNLEPVFGMLAWQGAARSLVAAVVIGGIYIGLRLFIALKTNSPSIRRFLLFFQRLGLKADRGEIPIWIFGLFGLVVLAFALVVLVPIFFSLLRFMFSPAVNTFGTLYRIEFPVLNVLSIAWIFTKGTIIPVVLFWAPYHWVQLTERLSESQLFRRLFIHGRGGSARWAGVLGYYNRRSAGPDTLFVGRSTYWDVGLDHGKKVGLGDDAHMLTIGCTGSGKSVTVIWPNLALYEGGIVVLDPKGEHARMTYWRRTAAEHAKGLNIKTKRHFAGSGVKGYKLDPFNQEQSIPPSYYNPLSEINIEDDRVLEKLAAIADGCVLPEGDKNQHWVEGSRTILEGVMAHVLSRESIENQNLPYVHDLLLGFDTLVGAASPDRLAALLQAMQENPIAGGICLKAASLIAHDTRGNMMTTVLRSIKWMGDPSMRRHLTMPSDFKFADIPHFHGSAGSTVYIVAPIGPLMKEQVRWLRVLTNLSITIIRLCPPPKRRTLFILDEFPQLQGKLTAVEEGIVTLRSAHVRLWPFIQQIGQLKKDYGANWNTFISSSNVQAFGVTDPETAEWLSEGMLGGTLHFRKEGNRLISDGPRPLLTSREVMTELGKNEPRAIVIPNDGGFPMRLERLAYKPMVIEGKQFGGLLLEGCFEEGK